MTGRHASRNFQSQTISVTGSLSCFNQSSYVLGYFMHKGSIYNFIWKQTLLMKKNVLQITVLWHETLKTTVHLFKAGTNSRLLTINLKTNKKLLAGPEEIPGFHFLVEVCGLKPTMSPQPTKLSFTHSTCPLSCQSLKIPLNQQYRASAL